MKLIAKSTVPSSMPYIHLGYLAATTTVSDEPMMLGGLLMLIVGTVLALKVRIGKTKRGFTTIFPRPRRPLKLALAGVAAVAVGCATVYLGLEHGREIYVHPIEVTTYNMHTIGDHITKSVKAGQTVPENREAMKAAWKIDRWTLEDGWFRPIEIKSREENGSPSYTLVSAGPDGRFDTNDDIAEDVKVE